MTLKSQFIKRLCLFLALLYVSPFQAHAQPNTFSDIVSPDIQFIQVEENVNLEILDWGGIGQPIVLISGGGDSAHVFNNFASKLADKYHVLGVTRRGFGYSSRPETGYNADRLGDDIAIVLDQLQLDKPFIIGHSIAGGELSNVANRYPKKIKGLVYLDAASPIAYDSNGDVAKFIQFNKQQLQYSNSTTPIELAKIMVGLKSYSQIPVPSLAIFPVPVNGTSDQTNINNIAISNLFEAGISNSKVVRIEGGDHYIYLSNEAQVLQEIYQFIDSFD